MNDIKLVKNTLEESGFKAAVTQEWLLYWTTKVVKYG